MLETNLGSIFYETELSCEDQIGSLLFTWFVNLDESAYVLL